MPLWCVFVKTTRGSLPLTSVTAINPPDFLPDSQLNTLENLMNQMKLRGCRGTIILNYPLANNTSAQLISIQQQAGSPGPVAPLGLLRTDVTSVFPPFCFFFHVLRKNKTTQKKIKIPNKQNMPRDPPGRRSQESQQMPEGEHDFVKGPEESTSPLIHINRPKPHNDFIISIYVSVATNPPNPSQPTPPLPIH